ncbi:hypothetical protein AE922_21200 [Xanthomonas arboricola]|nr:hypothetical protein AE922_21200 [Xanthomonas arboricola]KOB23636.1 hypothetical protein AE927_19385 [Xanthomonas arboricola]KOB50955.1 hypothetical protein AE932_04020 [Xanthomonas arboricola]
MDIRQNGIDPEQKLLPRFGQTDGPSVALKQFHIQLIFELFDLLTQRWLGHMQLFGCTGKTQLFCDRLEIS